MTAHKFSSPAK